MSVFAGGPVRLDGPQTMLAVLVELVGDDASSWRGMIDCWDTGDGVSWRLAVNDDKGNKATAVAGQHLALAYNRLLVLDDADL